MCLMSTTLHLQESVVPATANKQDAHTNIHGHGFWVCQQCAFLMQLYGQLGKLKIFYSNARSYTANPVSLLCVRVIIIMMTKGSMLTDLHGKLGRAARVYFPGAFSQGREGTVLSLAGIDLLAMGRHIQCQLHSYLVLDLLCACFNLAAFHHYMYIGEQPDLSLSGPLLLQLSWAWP